MWNTKFSNSTKNNSKRPEHERLHILSLPTRSKIPTTSLRLLLFPRVFSVPHTLVLSTVLPFTPPFQILSNILFFLQNETPLLVAVADNVEHQPHTLAYCWLLLTRSFDLEISNASTICNSSRWNSSTAFSLLGCYAIYVGSCLPTFQDSISVPSSRVFLDCLHSYEHTLRNTSDGRAMAQAVSRQPLTVEGRVRSRVSPCGIWGGQAFPRILRFFPVNFIPPVLHYKEKWKN
jgi:hypothetical protein